MFNLPYIIFQLKKNLIVDTEILFNSFFNCKVIRLVLVTNALPM